MNTQISLQLQIPQKTPFKNTEPDFSNFHKKKVSVAKKQANKGKQIRKEANKQTEITRCGLLPMVNRLYNYLNWNKKKIKIGRVYPD